jgi:ubiquinone/menaquinone biosynthesis C-methylase UbiE
MATDGTYEYRDLLASTWDLLRGDMADSPDRQFFRAVIQAYGDPALDVGCGTGRLLLDYLADGLHVEGVDVSPEMIELCRQKALKLSLEPIVYAQAIEALDLPTKYRTIIIPSYSFQLVPDLADAMAALDRFHDHLLPGGTLVVSIWHSKRDGPAEWSEWYLVAEKERPEDGLIVKRQERSMYDPETQLRHTENRYELLENDRVVYSEDHRRSPELRNYTLAQISDMLDRAGFTGIKAVSGYPSDLASGKLATEEDNFFCIISQKG